MKKIDRVKKRFVEEGIDIVLDKRKADRIYRKKTEGDFEAYIIALSCGDPPKGFSRWSLRLLPDKAVEFEYVDSISYEAIRHIKKKTNSNLGNKKGWLVPLEHNGSFVANMEKVLDIYKLPYDPLHPVVGMDESPKQLIGEKKSSDSSVKWMTGKVRLRVYPLWCLQYFHRL